MSFATFKRNFRAHQMRWGFICGAIIVGTVVKVAYFARFRGLHKERVNEINREGQARLREAREYGLRKREEHQKTLPKLTPEQDEQMAQYLKLIQAHGLKKITEMQNSQDCVGCPALHADGRARSWRGAAQANETTGNSTATE
ncbi:hypothetical protein ACA910_001688 [Epithemia clementina (nom. ined.)]